MSTTSRLGLTLVDQAASQKEVTLNSWLTTATQGLDNAALVTIANTFTQNQTIAVAPTASANVAALMVGSGGFAGGGTNFAGQSVGTAVGVNLASGSTSDLINLQIGGVQYFRIGNSGNVTLRDPGNLILGTTTGTKIGTSTSQLLGFWNATPVVQPAANQDIRASLIATGLIAGGINSLNLNGGDLTANQGVFSGGLQGSGTALQLLRISYTFASDANATLDATQKANVIIDIQAGVLTAQRDLLVSGNAGAFYIIINRNANPVNVRVGANTGIVVGATRSRIIVWPGGTTAFSLTQDNTYTT